MAQATDPLDELMRSLYTVVRSVGRGVERMGIDKASMIVLYSLRDADQVRPSAVAASCGLDVSTISRHLKRLEDEGLVERTSDPQDGRAQLLSATAHGRETLLEIDATRRAALDEVLREWTEDDRAQLATLLSRLADDLVLSQARTEATLSPSRG